MKTLSYAELVCGLSNASSTQIPALLKLLVEQAAIKRVFQPGGLVRFVERLDVQNNDTKRLDWLEHFFKSPNNPFLGYNDNPEAECDEGLMPVGFRIATDESVFVATSLRRVIDLAA